MGIYTNLSPRSGREKVAPCVSAGWPLATGNQARAAGDSDKRGTICRLLRRLKYERI
jgi:hypothetical protein